MKTAQQQIAVNFRYATSRILGPVHSSRRRDRHAIGARSSVSTSAKGVAYFRRRRRGFFKGHHSSARGKGDAKGRKQTFLGRAGYEMVERARAPPSRELFRGWSISGRVNIDSPAAAPAASEGDPRGEKLAKMMLIHVRIMLYDFSQGETVSERVRH